jgi:hypothetical protein
MTGTTILAIDPGQYKCAACAYDRVTTAAEFRTITTARAEVERFVRHPSCPVAYDGFLHLARAPTARGRC